MPASRVGPVAASGRGAGGAAGRSPHETRKSATPAAAAAVTRRGSGLRSDQLSGRAITGLLDRLLRPGGGRREGGGAGDLRPRGEADEEAARRRRRDEPEAEDEERRQDRVVRVRARHVLREREGRPGEGQRRGEAGAGGATADQGESAG